MDTRFFEVMEQVNPFAIKEANGKIKVYKDYAAAYQDVMTRMHEDSRRGYLDIPLFLTRHCGMELRQAKDFLENFYRSGALKKGDSVAEEGVALIDWSDYQFLLRYLPKFFCGLHWILETKFQNDMFLLALQRFCIKNGIVL